MDDLLGSFSGYTRVRQKCAEKICVGLWGQSTISMARHYRSEGPSVTKCYIFSL